MKTPQTCASCGQVWPHALLYRTVEDHAAQRFGLCPQCAWPQLRRGTASLRQGVFVFDVRNEQRDSASGLR